MKNQYFGDINDYRKYGLLRAIFRVADFRTVVTWMLTPDDGSTDGKFVKYLSEPEKWSKHDPSLYLQLSRIMASEKERKVEHIEKTGLLKNTLFYSQFVPDKAVDREAWFADLSARSTACDLMFLDPDNGLEVKSKPYGRKHSSKYLFWHEVESLWNFGKSLLIYQHFIREKRVNFIQRMLGALKNVSSGSYVEAFSTPHVVFLMALQQEHHILHEPIVKSVQASWSGQIKHWELTRAQQMR